MRLVYIILFMAIVGHAQNNQMKKSIYSFTVEDIDGNSFDFSSLKG